MYTYNDLSDDAKNELKKSFDQIAFTTRNTSYEICAYNKNATRYFHAIRKCIASNELNKSFGGGSYWTVKYGEVAISLKKDLAGDLIGMHCHGKTFTKKQDICIPQNLDTKAEVIELIRKLGIFNI